MTSTQKTYLSRTSKGVCRRCGLSKPDEGHLDCAPCIRMTSRDKARREAARKARDAYALRSLRALL